MTAHIYPAHARFDTPCACGHERRAHVDAFRHCDLCDCGEYDGEIIALPPTIVEVWDGADFVPADDDVLIYSGWPIY